MDDVLDRVRIVHHNGDVPRHLLLMVPVLLRDQDPVYPMGVVAGNTWI